MTFTDDFLSQITNDYQNLQKKYCLNDLTKTENFPFSDDVEKEFADAQNHLETYEKQIQHPIELISSIEKDILSLRYQLLFLNKLPTNKFEVPTYEKRSNTYNFSNRQENRSKNVKNLSENIKDLISSFLASQTIDKKNYNAFMNNELTNRIQKMVNYLNSLNYPNEELSELLRLTEYAQDL